MTSAQPAEFAAVSRPMRDRPATVLALAALTTILLAMVCGPPLAPVISPDTEGYVAVSADLGSDMARDRPPVYPLVIRSARALLGPRWLWGLMFFQIATLGLAAAILCGLFLRAGVPRGVAWALSVCGGAAPGLISYARAAMPEVLLAVLVAVAWQQTALTCSDSSETRKGAVRGSVAGLFSGLAALTKPVWVVGVVPLAAAVLAFGAGPIRLRWRRAALLVAFHAALILTWQTFLFARFSQTKISRLGAFAANMAAVRCGMTRYGSGTPLYRHLESVGLIDEALHLRWEDSATFMRIHDALPRDLKVDPLFERQVVVQHFGEFVLKQLQRIPAFFLLRPRLPYYFPAPRLDGGVALRLLRRAHAHFYAAFFRVGDAVRVSPCLLLVLFGAILAVLRPALRAPVGVSLLVLGYFVVVLVFLSFYDQVLVRYRVEVEPVMFFAALLPIGWVAARVARRFSHPAGRSDEARI